MNYKHTALLVTLFLWAFIGSCTSEQPTSNAPRPPAIYGHLLDAAGKPVANAGVNLLFGWDVDQDDPAPTKIILFPNPAIDEVTIYRLFQASGPFKLSLLRADTRALVRTVYDGQVEAGELAFSVDVKNLPNQAYILRYETPSDSGEEVLIVGRCERSNETPFIRTPLVRTDSDGRFTIHYSALPLGRRFYFDLEAGAPIGWSTINNSLRLRIDSPDSVKRRDWDIKVDTTAVVDSTVTLP